MKVVGCLTLLVLLSGCYTYHPLVASHNIQAGAVIKESDLRANPPTGWCGQLFYPDDIAENRKDVIGHVAIKFIHGGSDIHLSQVDH